MNAHLFAKFSPLVKQESCTEATNIIKILIFGNLKENILYAESRNRQISSLYKPMLLKQTPLFSMTQKKLSISIGLVGILKHSSAGGNATAKFITS